jgi:hypothetical protein
MAKKASSQQTLSSKDAEKLLGVLKARFEANANRHKGIEWSSVEAKLDANPEKLWSLNEMERTGGEPDEIAYDKRNGEYIFCDCSAESPSGRRSACYDREAQKANIKGRPDAKENVVDLAAAMGIELLGEDEYRELQKLGEFDLKSQSWIKTPSEVRKLGGALFCERRYGRVFVCPNGPQSYYSGRAFRGLLRV